MKIKFTMNEEGVQIDSAVSWADGIEIDICKDKLIISVEDNYAKAQVVLQITEAKQLLQEMTIALDK